MEMQSVYIGDGVYAIYDPARQGIELRANSLHSPTDTIFLEDDVIDSLVKFIKKHTIFVKEINNASNI